jgi:hypothetical protein
MLELYQIVFLISRLNLKILLTFKTFPHILFLIDCISEIAELYLNCQIYTLKMT